MEITVPVPEQGFEQQLNESFALFSHEPLQSSPDVQISPPSWAQVFIAVDAAAELFTCAAAVTSVCVEACARTVGCAGAVCSIRSPVHPATRTVPITNIPRTIEKRVDLLIVMQSPEKLLCCPVPRQLLSLPMQRWQEPCTGGKYPCMPGTGF